MSLESLIQRLLDSQTTPTVGDDSWTDNLYTGTAPTDGYLNVSGSANINTANAGGALC